MKPAEFILSMPGKHPKEIVAEAEKMDLKLTLDQVYKARWNEKRRKEPRKERSQKEPTAGTAQAKAYEFCKAYVEKNGRGPNGKEITAATGLARGGLSNAMFHLKQDGLLDWEPGNYVAMTIGPFRKKAAKKRSKGKELNGSHALAVSTPAAEWSLGGVTVKKTISKEDVLEMEQKLTAQYQAEMASIGLLKKLFGP